MTTSSAGVEICLTGTSAGAGYAAFYDEGKWVGDGEPHAGRDLHEAFWLAVAHLRATGVTDGEVAVFEPTGKWVAWFDLGRQLPRYGMLVWAPAPTWLDALDQAIAEVRHAA